MGFLQTYQERDALAIKVLELMHRSGALVWRARKGHRTGELHHGRFLLGVELHGDDRLIFSVMLSEWDRANWAQTLEYAPWADALSADERIERIRGL